ncbi:HEAT repeat domain-containing protein [Methanogenium sp. MK-MG]|uniref:HEAT repeat domain-containing protein n=1 Tax=Methanogenium sp. MK-MG TaxID=2599926 RepID=UPI0013E9B899|nr:HEAT repeat domain-containing protein [Methanogenium sp. MK-MG]
MRRSPALKAGALILLFLTVCISGCTQSTAGGDDTGGVTDQHIQALSSDDPDTELAAITWLTQAGEPAVQPIIDSFATGDNKTRIYGAFILQEIGAPAIPPLVAALDSEDTDTRSICGTTLVGMGAPAVPYLLDALERGDSDTQNVKQVLVRIGEPALPALQAAALSPNPTFAAEADALIKSIYFTAKFREDTQNMTAAAA